jgi:maleylpyruvate isomerase
VKLYNYWRSSSSWRVRIALAHKGLDYEYVPVNLIRDGGEQHKDIYAGLNPMHEVPTLTFEEGGRTVVLAQSMAILEYLEERFPTPSLLPRDPVQRGKVRQLANMVNAGIQPLQNLAVLIHVEQALRADKNAWAAHWIERGLHALEQEARRLAGKALVGDAVSFADVCLVPQLAAARRFGVALDALPTLLRIESNLAALPAFQKAHADRQMDAPAPAPERKET